MFYVICENHIVLETADIEEAYEYASRYKNSKVVELLKEFNNEQE